MILYLAFKSNLSSEMMENELKFRQHSTRYDTNIIDINRLQIVS